MYVPVGKFTSSLVAFPPCDMFNPDPVSTLVARNEDNISNAKSSRRSVLKPCSCSAIYADSRHILALVQVKNE